MNAEVQSALDVSLQVRRGKRLLRHVWDHFQEDRCFEEAASLGYTSLLAMVPLLAVVFGIIAAFPVFNDWSDSLQAFVFDTSCRPPVSKSCPTSTPSWKASVA
jgi:membrane protein